MLVRLRSDAGCESDLGGYELTVSGGNDDGDLLASVGDTVDDLAVASNSERFLVVPWANPQLAAAPFANIRDNELEILARGFVVELLHDVRDLLGCHRSDEAFIFKGHSPSHSPKTVQLYNKNTPLSKKRVVYRA